MKILLVDNGVTGHHISYIRAIMHYCDREFVLVLPSPIDGVTCTQYAYKNHIESERNIRVYLRWIEEIRNIANQEAVDVIHFLEGDTLYRFLGIGLQCFKQYKVFITFHRIGAGFIKRISTYRISSLADRVIVHSKYILDAFNSMHIYNAHHIEYPQFNMKVHEKKQAKQHFGMDVEIPVIGCIGATREEKGLDCLLLALKKVKYPFQLLIAGKEIAFNKEFITENTKEYNKYVYTNLKFMSEDELSWAFGACDIICLPYRKSFNGASGPLGEGVALGCCIIGPEHGNLGDTILSNHLGYTFEAENIDDLTDVVSKALEKTFVPDAFYLRYKRKLSPEQFGADYNKLYSDCN